MNLHHASYYVAYLTPIDYEVKSKIIIYDNRTFVKNFKSAKYGTIIDYHTKIIIYLLH